MLATLVDCQLAIEEATNIEKEHEEKNNPI